MGIRVRTCHSGHRFYHRKTNERSSARRPAARRLSTRWSASTFLPRRASTFPNARWSRSYDATRKAFCAARRRDPGTSAAPRATSTGRVISTPTCHRSMDSAPSPKPTAGGREAGRVPPNRDTGTSRPSEHKRSKQGTLSEPLREPRPRLGWGDRRPARPGEFEGTQATIGHKFEAVIAISKPACAKRSRISILEEAAGMRGTSSAHARDGDGRGDRRSGSESASPPLTAEGRARRQRGRAARATHSSKIPQTRISTKMGPIASITKSPAITAPDARRDGPRKTDTRRNGPAGRGSKPLPRRSRSTSGRPAWRRLRQARGRSPGDGSERPTRRSFLI